MRFPPSATVQLKTISYCAIRQPSTSTILSKNSPKYEKILQILRYKFKQEAKLPLG